MENKTALEIDANTGFVINPSFPINKILEILKNLDYKPMLVTEACKTIGINRKDFYHQKEIDVKFSDELERIKNKHLDQVEQVMLDNAKNYKGVSDRVTLLKAHRPDVYNPVKKVEITDNSKLKELIGKAKEYVGKIEPKIVNE